MHITRNNVNLNVFETREEMGRAGASLAASEIRRMLSGKETVNILFAAAPSQNDILKSLSEEQGIDWSRVNAFHMDEYIGLPENAPQSFGNYLYEHFFKFKNFRNIYYISKSGNDIESICRNYSELLRENAIDIGFLGIGENGHIAFNDPHIADFNDPLAVKVVELDDVCRQQQVNDGCFRSLKDVPEKAVTLTIPVLFSIPVIFFTAPTINKAKAIHDLVYGPISTECPASILRNHKHTCIFLDTASASLVI